MNLLPVITPVKVIYEDRDFKNIKKPLIIISNHRNIFDPWYIAYALPFFVLFGKIFPLRPYSSLLISKENKFLQFLKSVGVVKFIYFIYNTISIPNSDSFEDKISPLINSIENNESILIFPEGKLVKTDSVSEFKKGIARIHQLTNVPILPVAIRYEKNRGFRYAVYVSVGTPFRVPAEVINNDVANDFLNTRVFLRSKVYDLHKKLLV